MRRLDRPRLRDAIKLLTDEKWSHYEGDDPSTIGWINPENAPSIEQINAKFEELNAAEPMRLLREERNRRLTETDWMSFSDSPTMTDEWKTYRQALRDLPQNFSPIIDIITEDGYPIVKEQTDWPTKPE